METFRQFLLQWPTFARLKLKHLGSHTFGQQEDVAETDNSRLNKFVIGLKPMINLIEVLRTPTDRCYKPFKRDPC